MSGRYWLSGTTPVDSSGNPYPLATLTFYIVGTTTPTDVYTTGALTVAHQNPLTLGADGRIPEIFMDQTRLKVVFKDADGVTVSGLSFDGIDKSKQRVRSAAAPSPTYPGLEWVDSDDNTLYERNAANDGWVNRGDVDSVGNTASVTETLAGTEAAKYVTPDSLAALWEKGADVTIDTNNISLPSTGGGFHICGTATTTLTTISSRATGIEVEISFTNAQTITHGSGINTLSGANESILAGTRCRFRRNASDWTMTSRTTAPATQAIMETGTDVLAAVTPGRQHFHPGHPKWWGFVTVSAGTPTLQSSYNLTSITDTNTGILTATIANDLSGVNWAPFVSVQWTATSPGDTQTLTCAIRNGTIAAGTVGFDCYDQQASQAYADPTSWSIMGMGDI